MIEIVFVIIALIIKLAYEGAKEYFEDFEYTSKPYKGRTTLNSSTRTKIGTERTSYSSSKGTTRTKSLNDILNQQTTASTITTAASQLNKEEKPEIKIDTEDYEDFTTPSTEQFTEAEIKQIEKEEVFVEETLRKVDSYDLRANKIKFMIYTLVYCMYEDDNEFTRKEKRMFKMITRVASVNLREKDTLEIKSFIDVRPNLDSIVRKQQAYSMDINDVLETLASLRKHLKGNKGYTPIIQRIENRFQYEL